MAHAGHSYTPFLLVGLLTHRTTKKKKAWPPGSVSWTETLGLSSCSRCYLDTGSPRLGRATTAPCAGSTHLQAEGPGREGRDAAGQGGAPERGFGFPVLIGTQPSWLVLLPCSERKEGAGECEPQQVALALNPDSHHRPQRARSHGDLIALISPPPHVPLGLR